MAYEDLWKCPICGKVWVVPSLAKDCCTRKLDGFLPIA